MSYLPKLFSSGAIRKTPDRIIERMVDETELKNTDVIIVEAGAGMGEITEAVLNKGFNKEALHYLAFETDLESCEQLRRKFPEIKVLNESIFDFEKFLPADTKVDYFISSIPFSFYKNDLIKEFFEKVKTNLKDDGKIILLFTAAWLMPIFKKSLTNVKTEAFLTFPPYFIMVYENQKSN